jgi:hypothetical protein
MIQIFNKVLSKVELIAPGLASISSTVLAHLNVFASVDRCAEFHFYIKVEDMLNTCPHPFGKHV